MRKSWTNVFVAVTVLFLGFTAGFFVGRNANHQPVALSAAPRAAPTVESSVSQTAPATAPRAAPPPTDPVPPPSAPATEKVNINTADLSQLMTLPGIGRVLGQRILDYREENGPFSSLSDLTNVSGIGTKRLEGLLEYATIGGSE